MDLRLASADRWWTRPLPVGSTLLGFCPSSKSTRGCERRLTRGLYALRHRNLATPASYERFTPGATPRHRDIDDPSWRLGLRPPEPHDLATVEVSLDSFVSVTELGTAPHSTRGNF